MFSATDFYEAIIDNPVIVAVIDQETYDFALKSDNKIVFLLDASISNLKDRVSALLKQKKYVFVHIDMVAGLTSTIAVVDFIADIFNKEVGIITTKYPLIKRANQKNIRSIYRVFMVDSKSKRMFKSNLKQGIYPDAIEIMPAFVGKVIEEIIKEFPKTLVIAGGLITSKKEAYSILNSGATAISTSAIELLSE